MALGDCVNLESAVSLDIPCERVCVVKFDQIILLLLKHSVLLAPLSFHKSKKGRHYTTILLFLRFNFGHLETFVCEFSLTHGSFGFGELDPWQTLDLFRAVLLQIVKLELELSAYLRPQTLYHFLSI